MDHSLVMVKGLASLNEAMGHAMQGHPRWTGHSGEFWQMYSTGGGNDKPLQYTCLENPMNSMKRQKGMTPEDNPPNLIFINLIFIN